MNIQPKIEPGSSPTNSNNYLEDKSIHDLVKMLRGTCKSETFDRVELVLESRNTRLREEFHMERLLRLHAESEFRKRDEIIEKGKIIQVSYEALLKEVKIMGKRETVEVLQKMNNELEIEVKKLKGKYVDGNIEIDVLRRKNGELESEVLELRKLNEKMVEDNNQLVLLREMIGKLENEVLELRNSKKKWLDDSSAHDELRSNEENDSADLKIKTDELKETMKKNLETISQLRKENDKRMFEILLRPLYKKFRGLNGRVSRLEDDINFEENEEEYVRDNEFRNDTVEEAAHHTLGVSASTQPQGATSGRGTLKVKKDIDLIHLHDDDDDDDDDDDNGDRCMAQGVHEEKTIYGIAVKHEDPTLSSSLAVQQKTKFANAVDTVKRKFSFSDSETSTSSSDDSSFLHNLTRRSAVLLAKKKKNCSQTVQD